MNAKPRFRGHYQPHLPADLGFYDLRVPETRQAQADMANAYGIHGFCYYHYWFNGRRILERPFNEVFESGAPSFPFMLCWANENWTRVWDGGENAVLLRQEYSLEDDRRHIRALIPYFRDERYIRVGDKPVFAFYKDSLFPDIRSTLEVFRTEAYANGFELYLVRFERYKDTGFSNPADAGFDAAVEFQPLSRSWGEYVARVGSKPNTATDRLSRWISRRIGTWNGENRRYSMPQFVEYDLSRPQPDYKIFPGVCPGWDNSSRRVGRTALIFEDSTPQVFEAWARGKVKSFRPYSADENFLFVNAWNEWAEGNHLEPDQRFGLSFLESLRNALNLNSNI